MRRKAGPHDLVRILPTLGDKKNYHLFKISQKKMLKFCSRHLSWTNDRLQKKTETSATFKWQKSYTWLVL